MNCRDNVYGLSIFPYLRPRQPSVLHFNGPLSLRPKTYGTYWMLFPTRPQTSPVFCPTVTTLSVHLKVTCTVKRVWANLWKIIYLAHYDYTSTTMSTPSHAWSQSHRLEAGEERVLWVAYWALEHCIASRCHWQNHQQDQGRHCSRQHASAMKKIGHCLPI